MGWYQRRVHGVFNTLLTINLYHIYMNSVLSHTEISSNPFCLIQNCPWLVFIAQGFFFVILLSLNLYFWRIDGFPFSFHLIVIILFFCILCLINFYFIDLVREAYKKYEVLYMMLFIVFFIFIVSEALLFISFFWAALHVISSPSFVQEGFFFSRPLSITLLKYSIIISRSLFTRSSFCRFRNFLLFFDIFLFYFSNFSLGFYIFTNI